MESERARARAREDNKMIRRRRERESAVNDYTRKFAWNFRTCAIHRAELYTVSAALRTVRAIRFRNPLGVYTVYTKDYKCLTAAYRLRAPHNRYKHVHTRTLFPIAGASHLRNRGSTAGAGLLIVSSAEAVIENLKPAARPALLPPLGDYLARGTIDKPRKKLPRVNRTSGAGCRVFPEIDTACVSARQKCRKRSMQRRESQ